MGQGGEGGQGIHIHRVLGVDPDAQRTALVHSGIDEVGSHTAVGNISGNGIDHIGEFSHIRETGISGTVQEGEHLLIAGKGSLVTLFQPAVVGSG